MSRRVIVIGGDAAGMSAASTARRRGGEDVELLVFERSRWTSYSACGIPYWIAGDVHNLDELVARTPERHRDNGIDLRTHVEVIALDPAAATVTVRADEEEESYAYDDLVIATGAEPYRPDLPGIDATGIFGVQSLDDGQAILSALDSGPKRAVVVGSGYIGIEMAEACVRRGLETTLVDRAETPMGTLDPELGKQVHEAMTGMGIDVRMGVTVTGFENRGGGVAGVATADGAIDTDVVILGIGVRARSELARSAGLPLGAKDAIRVDSRQRVDVERHVWAAGDCVESYDRVSGEHVHVPLGTHANKQGWIVGRNLTGDDVEFPGIVGTAMTKVCGLEIGRTGLGESAARDAGFDPVAVSIDATTKAGYMPGAEPLTIKMVADRVTRRVLGAQLIGREESVLRIDTVAMAVWTQLTVDELMLTDLGYAPPFSPVWDPVQVAARALVSRLGQ